MKQPIITDEMYNLQRDNKLELYETWLRSKIVSKIPDHEYLSEYGKRVLFFQGEEQ